MDTRLWRALLPLSASLFVAVACGSAKTRPAEEPGLGPEERSPADVAKEEEAGRLMGQGGFAASDGDDEKALSLYLDAARILDGLGRVTVDRGEAHFLAGEVAEKLYKNALALEHFEKAVDIYLRFSGNSKIKAANALANMGAIHKQTGALGKARDCWTRALNIYKASPPEYRNSRNMGKIEQNLRDLSSGY